MVLTCDISLVSESKCLNETTIVQHLFLTKFIIFSFVTIDFSEAFKNSCLYFYIKFDSFHKKKLSWDFDWDSIAYIDQDEQK